MYLEETFPDGKYVVSFDEVLQAQKSCSRKDKVLHFQAMVQMVETFNPGKWWSEIVRDGIAKQKEAERRRDIIEQYRGEQIEAAVFTMYLDTAIEVPEETVSDNALNVSTTSSQRVETTHSKQPKVTSNPIHTQPPPTKKRRLSDDTKH